MIDRLLGKVYIKGKDVYSLNNNDLAVFRRQNVGLIYQFYNLIPILNVEENISLPVLLDGGQQQRVSIGRSLMNDPAIILADEPTGNLDSKNSEEILELLKYSNKKYHQTLIMITHDLNLAKQANRMIQIQDGKIVADEKN